MSEEFFRHVSWRARLAGALLIPGVPILVFLLLVGMRERPPLITTAAVMGCYVTPDAPSISIEAEVIRIDQPDMISPPFEIERNKWGLFLLVKAPISLSSDGAGRQLFRLDERGTGYFWPLLQQTGNGEFVQLENAEDFAGAFSVTARDGPPVIYKRNSTAPCALFAQVPHTL